MARVPELGGADRGCCVVVWRLNVENCVVCLFSCAVGTALCFRACGELAASLLARCVRVDTWRGRGQRDGGHRGSSYIPPPFSTLYIIAVRLSGVKTRTPAGCVPCVSILVSRGGGPRPSHAPSTSSPLP